MCFYMKYNRYCKIFPHLGAINHQYPWYSLPVSKFCMGSPLQWKPLQFIFLPNNLSSHYNCYYFTRTCCRGDNNELKLVIWVTNHDFSQFFTFLVTRIIHRVILLTTKWHIVGLLFVHNSKRFGSSNPTIISPTEFQTSSCT